MSKQVNFYAAPGDTEMIHRWLLEEFPGLMVVSKRRGPLEHTQPMPATEPQAFWRYAASALVPAWARPLLHVEDLAPEFPGEFIVTAQDSPVIEYRPGGWDPATQTATATRFYWAYTGELPSSAIRQVNRLFDWVRSHTEAIPKSLFRIFPVAAKTARFLAPHVGSPKPNPFFHDVHVANL